MVIPMITDSQQRSIFQEISEVHFILKLDLADSGLWRQDVCEQSNVVLPIDHNTINNIDKVASINKQFVYQSHFVMNVVLTVYGILLLVSLDEVPEVVPIGTGSELIWWQQGLNIFSLRESFV